MAPSSDEPNQGLDFDLGASLHEWTTRWSQIDEDRGDEPGEALRDATQLLDEMALQRHVESDPASSPGTEEFTRSMQGLRDLVDRYENDGPVDADEYDDAFENAREMFDLLVGDRDDAAAGP
jgi:predicted HAD superfamily Cof-like phosphohydrolase